MNDDLFCRLCLNTDPFLSFSPICLDLLTLTLGSLAITINPTFSPLLNPSFLCKACEAIMLDFKLHKSMVQANIQFVIDNKEEIQVHG